MPDSAYDPNSAERSGRQPASVDKANKAGRVTTRKLRAMRNHGKRITMLTAYDYPTAEILDSAGIDILLVGDSLAMVVQGHETTLPVTMDQMIYHAEMVGRAASRAMVVVDLPFPDGQLEVLHSVRCAARVLKETSCHAVKLEGGAEQGERIEALVGGGIPVMAHVGLRPQNVLAEGGYRVQRDGDRLVRDAKRAEQAGAFAVLVECVPADVGRAITEAIEVPTIGIGAGPFVSGQVLVTNDLVGLTADRFTTPKFVRQLADVKQVMREAVITYRDAIHNGDFPDDSETFQ